MRGWGRLVGLRRVRVGDTVFTASVGVVLATGSAPVRPPIPGLAEAGYWTNRQAVEATGPPGSLLVLGGGAVGLELAQAFARFGSVVTGRPASTCGPPCGGILDALADLPG